MTKHLQKRFTLWAVIVGGILMIPLIAQFPWSMGDFILAGLVLYGAAAGYEITASYFKKRLFRILIAIGAISGVILVWGWAVR